MSRDPASLRKSDSNITADHAMHRRIKPADEKAFAAQYGLHSPYVFGFCVLFKSNRDEAIKLLESVFWNFWSDGVWMSARTDTLGLALVKSAVRIHFVELRRPERKEELKAALDQLRSMAGTLFRK